VGCDFAFGHGCCCVCNDFVSVFSVCAEEAITSDVLSLVSKYLPLEDMLQVRLVNKAWNNFCNQLTNYKYVPNKPTVLTLNTSTNNNKDIANAMFPRFLVETKLRFAMAQEYVPVVEFVQQIRNHRKLYLTLQPYAAWANWWHLIIPRVELLVLADFTINNQVMMVLSRIPKVSLNECNFEVTNLMPIANNNTTTSMYCNLCTSEEEVSMPMLPYAKIDLSCMEPVFVGPGKYWVFDLPSDEEVSDRAFRMMTQNTDTIALCNLGPENSDSLPGRFLCKKLMLCAQDLCCFVLEPCRNLVSLDCVYVDLVPMLVCPTLRELYLTCAEWDTEYKIQEVFPNLEILEMYDFDRDTKLPEIVEYQIDSLLHLKSLKLTLHRNYPVYLNNLPQLEQLIIGQRTRIQQATNIRALDRLILELRDMSRSERYGELLESVLQPVLEPLDQDSILHRIERHRTMGHGIFELTDDYDFYFD
jgi:hypothetical protein